MAQHQSSTIGITENDLVVYETGQRRCGPPSQWTGDLPAKGCEVFIAKIPKSCFENELIPIMRQVGEIYTFRLMMENEEVHRGFGFCLYTSADSANEAVAKLNNYQIRKNCFLGVCCSVDNCRLFVGGIPKLKIKSEILTEMSKVTENVVDVIVYPSAADKNKNRGFAFVEYTDHKSAAVARKTMIGNGTQLWGQNVAVDWAEPERKVDDETMSKVKILYVRNLMLTTTEDTIYKTFSKFTTEEDEIVRVRKIGDFAFVHFKNRNQAAIVKDNLDGTDLEGSVIEVHFAKPANKLEQQQKLFKKRATSFTNMLSTSVTNEMRKMSIESNNSKLTSPTSFDVSHTGKSYRNAVGRCLIKPKQTRGNKEQNEDICFSNFAEMLVFVCQINGWEGPLFSVQIIPMFYTDKNTTIPVFIANVCLPSINGNFPSRTVAFTQEDAIMNASETALLSMMYGGMTIPNLWEESKDDIGPVNDVQLANINYGNGSDVSVASNKPVHHQPSFVQPMFQYNPLTPYYANHFMMPETCHPFYQVADTKNPEADNIPLSFKENPMT